MLQQGHRAHLGGNETHHYGILHVFPNILDFLFLFSVWRQNGCVGQQLQNHPTQKTTNDLSSSWLWLGWGLQPGQPVFLIQWYIQYKCQGCEYVPGCRQMSKLNDNIACGHGFPHFLILKDLSSLITNKKIIYPSAHVRLSYSCRTLDMYWARLK